MIMTDFKTMMEQKMAKNNEGRGVVVGIGPDYGRYVEIGEGKDCVRRMMTPHNAHIEKMDSAQGENGDVGMTKQQKDMFNNSAPGVAQENEGAVDTKKSLSQMIAEKNTTGFVKGNNPTAPDRPMSGNPTVPDKPESGNPTAPDKPEERNPTVSDH